MAYDYKAIGDMIDSLRGSGNEAQAWAMFNGLSGMGDATAAAGGVAGNLDSYLRTRWGDSAAKQWVNNMDTKYGNTLFDPKTGKWGGMGQAAGQSGTIAGWDPTQYAAGGMGVGGVGYTPSGYGSGAGGFGAAGTTPGAAAATGAAPGTGGGDPAAMAGSYTAPTRSAAASSPFDFFNDPGYQFLKKEGMNGIQNSAAAGGSLASGKTLKDLASFNSGLASQEYGKAFDRYTNARDFEEGKYRNDRDFGRGVFESDRGFGEGQFRDRRDFGENARRYNQDFGENQRRWDLGFNEGNRRDARDFDYRSGIDARNFQYGVDQDNRNFGYGASVADRNWLTSVLQGLSGQGLGATQGNSSLMQYLAQLLSGTTMAGAGAGAAGNVGSASGMNGTLSQIIQYLQSQQMANQYGGGGSGVWAGVPGSSQRPGYYY